MNPSNPIPWVKLILIDEPIPTHLMNYTCALCQKAYFIHEKTIKVILSRKPYKFLQQKCAQYLSWIPVDEWMNLH